MTNNNGLRNDLMNELKLIDGKVKKLKSMCQYSENDTKDVDWTE